MAKKIFTEQDIRTVAKESSIIHHFLLQYDRKQIDFEHMLIHMVIELDKLNKDIFLELDKND